MVTVKNWGRVDPDKVEDLEHVLTKVVNKKSLNLRIKEKFFVKKDGDHKLNEGYSTAWQHDICRYLSEKNRKVKILIGWTTIPILSFGSIVIDYKGNVSYEKKWYHFGDYSCEKSIIEALEEKGLLKTA